MFASMDSKLYQGFYTTPPLWVNTQFGIPQFDFPKLDLSNFKCAPVPNNLRLGHQMEFIFAQLLEYSPNWKVLAKNLLVDVGKNRVGELDFILYNIIAKATYHIELAYKFYIVDPEISEPVHRLMGPNKKDMCFTKLDKLKEKQFPLLFNKALTQKLESLAVDPTVVVQQACFKAQYNTANIHIRPLNKGCVTGSWIPFDAFNTKQFKDYQYYIPFKKEWVLQPELERPYLSHFETLLDVNLRMAQENAPMLWMKKPDNTLEKLFVVWW